MQKKNLFCTAFFVIHEESKIRKESIPKTIAVLSNSLIFYALTENTYPPMEQFVCKGLYEVWCYISRSKYEF